jgi:hypothetical protein
MIRQWSYAASSELVLNLAHFAAFGSIAENKHFTEH